MYKLTDDEIEVLANSHRLMARIAQQTTVNEAAHEQAENLNYFNADEFSDVEQIELKPLIVDDIKAKSKDDMRNDEKRRSKFEEAQVLLIWSIKKGCDPTDYLGRELHRDDYSKFIVDAKVADMATAAYIQVTGDE